MHASPALALTLALALASSLASAQEGEAGHDGAPPAPADGLPPLPPPPPLPPLALRAALPPPPAEPVRTQVYSGALLVGGILVAAAGTAGLIGGIAGIHGNDGSAPCTSSLACALGTTLRATTDAPYLMLAVAGGITAAGGAVMIGFGARQVPVRPAVGEPQVWAGLGAAGLRWRF